MAKTPRGSQSTSMRTIHPQLVEKVNSLFSFLLPSARLQARMIQCSRAGALESGGLLIPLRRGDQNDIQTWAYSDHGSLTQMASVRIHRNAAPFNLSSLLMPLYFGVANWVLVRPRNFTGFIVFSPSEFGPFISASCLFYLILKIHIFLFQLSLSARSIAIISVWPISKSRL